MLEAQRRDVDWMRRHIWASIFDNVAWTFDDPKHGDLTIQPLANSDTVTYLRTSGSSSTDEHYLAQAASIDDDNNPFPTIYTELMEHPSNAGGDVVVFIPTNLKSSVEGLTGFHEVSDPNVIEGIATARLDESRLASIQGPGNKVLGYVDGCWIVEWGALPDSYMLAHATGGGPVVKMREYPASELQGFFPEQFSPDGNLMEQRMIRYAGFGVSNRIAMVVYYVGGGAYAIPSGYGAPLAV
jgi:hypothetical protein